MPVRRQVPIRARPRRAAAGDAAPQVQDGGVPHLRAERRVPLRHAMPLHPLPRPDEERLRHAHRRSAQRHTHGLVAGDRLRFRARRERRGGNERAPRRAPCRRGRARAAAATTTRATPTDAPRILWTPGASPCSATSRRSPRGRRGSTAGAGFRGGDPPRGATFPPSRSRSRSSPSGARPPRRPPPPCGGGRHAAVRVGGVRYRRERALRQRMRRGETQRQARRRETTREERHAKSERDNFCIPDFCATKKKSRAFRRFRSACHGSTDHGRALLGSGFGRAKRSHGGVVRVKCRFFYTYCD